MKLFKAIRSKIKRVFSPKYRNLCKTRAKVGRLGGIKSGEARRLRKIEREIEKDILRRIPEIEVISKVLAYFEIDIEPIRLLQAYLRVKKEFLKKKQPKYDI